MPQAIDKRVRWAIHEPLTAAVKHAVARGLFHHEQVQSRLTQIPEWLAAFQEPPGFSHFEEQAGIVIPLAVKAFWREPALVCLLDAWGRDNYLRGPPAVVVWNRLPYLSVCSQGHSASLAAAALDAGDDPPLYWGWVVAQEPENPAVIFASRFSEFVLGSVRHIDGAKLIRYLPHPGQAADRFDCRQRLPVAHRLTS